MKAEERRLKARGYLSEDVLAGSHDFALRPAFHKIGHAQ